MIICLNRRRMVEKITGIDLDQFDEKFTSLYAGTPAAIASGK
jgi:hypothetical protein